jgi:hypothetical protein
MSPLRLTARCLAEGAAQRAEVGHAPAIQLNGSAGWVTHVCLGGHPVVGTIWARYERPTAYPHDVDPEARTDP